MLPSCCLQDPSAWGSQEGSRQHPRDPAERPVGDSPPFPTEGLQQCKTIYNTNYSSFTKLQMNYFTFFFSIKSSKCSVYFTLTARLHTDRPHCQVLDEDACVAGNYCVQQCTVYTQQYMTDSGEDSLIYLESKVNRIKRKQKERYETTNTRVKKRGKGKKPTRLCTSHEPAVPVITPKLQGKLNVGCDPHLRFKPEGSLGL